MVAAGTVGESLTCSLWRTFWRVLSACCPTPRWLHGRPIAGSLGWQLGEEEVLINDLARDQEKTIEITPRVERGPVLEQHPLDAADICVKQDKGHREAGGAALGRL